MTRPIVTMLLALISGSIACYGWRPAGEGGDGSLVVSSPPASVIPPSENAPSLEGVSIQLELVSDEVARPTSITHAGDGSNRLFVVEKAGTIQIISEGALLDTPFLSITDRVGSSGSEQGLLGMAFHPHYSENGYFYVNYTNRDGNTVVARFTATGDTADPQSEFIVLTQEQPAANHNGGHLAFGPDGYLYIGLGDGGLANDAFDNAQNGAALLGKMLRIDVDGGSPYAIPPDNPFVEDDDIADEIWAIGLRNPWRYSFDRETGDLYIGDVGQGAYEEINFQPAAATGGQNYGWPIMEGMHCNRGGSCEPEGFTLPVAEYSHAQGCSVTGGYVYRGAAFPSLVGIYFFGDYCSGLIWGLVLTSDGWHVAQLLEAGIQLSSFGEDEAGELYVTDLGGAVYQIVAPTDE